MFLDISTMFFIIKYMIFLICNVIFMVKGVRVRVTYTPQAPSSLPNEIFHELINITYFDVRIADKSIPQPQYVMKLEEISYRKEKNEQEIVSFYGFRNLNLVSMIENGQKTMPNFRDLPKLRKVQIKRTKIKEIGSNNVGQTPVEVLDFQENEIEKISKGAFGRKVHSVDLKCNKLRRIESNWFKSAATVEWLNFENNQIEFLQENLFKKFRKLSELYLGRNYIRTLEAGSLSGPTNFYVLDLGTNDIEVINANVFSENLTFIENLKISFNRLSFLSTDLTNKIYVNNNTDIYANPWQCACLKLILDWLPITRRYIVPNEATCILTKDFNENCVYDPKLNTELYNTFITSYEKVDSRKCASKNHIVDEKPIFVDLSDWNFGKIDIR